MSSSIQFTGRLSKAWSRSVCLLALGLPSLVHAATLDFEGSEYVANASAVSVDDADLSGAASWQAFSGSAASAWQVAAGEGSAGSKALRLADGSAASAYAYFIDAAGAADTSQPFTVAFDFKLTGENATNGTQQAWFQFGRAASSGWGFSNNWVYVDAHGDKIRLMVDGSGGTRVGVEVGTVVLNTYARVRVTVDPVAKRYINVVVNNVDVTAKVQAVGNGTIPWRTTSTDTTLPNASFWVTAGTDDKVNIHIDNLYVGQTPENWYATKSDEWIEYPYSSTQVAAGSALNFSELFNRTVDITARGFAFVDRDGELSFPDGTKARFFVMSEAMEGGGFVIPDGLGSAALNTWLDDYVTRVVRAGYNAYRPHFLDHFLMKGATADFQINAARLDIWQRLAAKLRAQGVYLLMDATTSWASYYPPSGNYFNETSYLRRLKVKLCYDQAVRDHWAEAMRILYTTGNPNLSPVLALKDDAQVVLNNLRNEPALYFQLTAGDKQGNLKDDTSLLACWRAWLTKKYGSSFAALQSAWGSFATGYAGFDALPILLPSATVGTNTQPVEDLRYFEVEIEQETFAWMQQVIRDLGVKSILTDFNNTQDLPNTMIRDSLALEDNHTYHDHPVAAGAYYTQSGVSSIDDIGQYVRSMAQSRFAGKPMTVTEWGHVFWNPFRYEGGLVFPSYAGLQGWSAISQHSNPIALTSAPARMFGVSTDPIAKASEYMAGLLYGRGDVSMSPHFAEVAVDNTGGNTNYRTTGNLPFSMNMMSLLTRLGSRVRWSVVAEDDFENDTVLTTATTVNDPGLGNSPFWTVYNNGSGSAALSAGGVALTATGGSSPTSYPSTMLRTQASPAFDWLAYPRQVELRGIGFSTNASGGVAPSQQLLRLAFVNGTGLLNAGSSRSLFVEVRGDRQVTVGYKMDSSGTTATARTVPATDFGGATITGIAFNPMASDVNELDGSGVLDATYDLVVYLSGAGSTPAYRHYTGKWGSTVNATNWGPATSNTIQLESKRNGGSPSQFSTAWVGHVVIGARPVGPRVQDLATNYSLLHPTQTGKSVATVVNDLKSAAVGILPAGNATAAPVDESYSGTLGVNSPLLNTGVYQSDTAQLTLAAGKRAFSVVTGRSVGVTVPARWKFDEAAPAVVTVPGVLSVNNLPAPYQPASCAVFVSTVAKSGAAYDLAQTVQTSGRLLMIVASDALNSGQRFVDYRRLAAYDATGSVPLLLKRVNLAVTLQNSYAASLKVYPLNEDGSRRGALAGLVRSAGSVQIPIDTGDASKTAYGAIYFELATD